MLSRRRLPQMFLVLTLCLPAIATAQVNGRVVSRTETGVVLEWQHGPAPSVRYQIRFLQNDKMIAPLGAANNPQFVVVNGPPNAGGTVRATSAAILRPEFAYHAQVSVDDEHEVMDIFIPPFQPEPIVGAMPNVGAGPIAPSPAVIVSSDDDEHLSTRIQFSEKMATAYGDYLRGAGEYESLSAEAQLNLARARKKVAEAVDHELDNWKKHVIIHFQRREANMLGRMQQRDLYDLRSDQTLHLRDKAAQRRYEYITRHATNAGGTARNLNSMLDLFVGTSLGYGVKIEDFFQSNPKHDRWTLTPDMLRKLRVRTKAENGKWIEFALDQPHVIALNWPEFFKQPQYNDYRRDVEFLSGKLTTTTDTDQQMRLIEELENAFAYLSNGFFAAFGSKEQRAGWTGDQFMHYVRAEEFLHQKTRELRLFHENPDSTLHLSKSFDIDMHGKDAGTLIAWMNGGGLSFAKPRAGDSAAYQKTFNMMKELYALLGEPIMQQNQQ